MGGPHMAYEPGTLRDGAARDREAADRAAAAEAALRSGSVSASAFGDVGHAAVMAAQAVLTRDEQAAGAAAEDAHRTDQGARADSAAAQGAGLTGRTTGIAGGA